MDDDKCLCKKSYRINKKSSRKNLLKELAKLHHDCPAVRVLIPDFQSWLRGYVKLVKKQREKQRQRKSELKDKSSWLANIETCSHCEYRFSCDTYNKGLEKETAFHQSTLAFALRRGHLNRITSPIHRYCLSKEKSLCRQYEKDLREAWFSYDDPSKRHKKLRIWMGRMAELKVAEWLEENNWKIEGLEAWGDKSDIEAISPDKKETLIEVKYIGQEDEDFKHLVAHLAGGPAVQSLNPYVPFNYVLFRIFEAAKQLSERPNSANAKKKVALVIDSSTWDLMKLQLKWIPGNNRYRFFEEEVKEDKKWQDFLRKEKLPKNDSACIPTTTVELNEITIFQLQEWELIKEMEWTPPENLDCKIKLGASF